MVISRAAQTQPEGQIPLMVTRLFIQIQRVFKTQLLEQMLLMPTQRESIILRLDMVPSLITQPESIILQLDTIPCILIQLQIIILQTDMLSLAITLPDHTILHWAPTLMLMQMDIPILQLLVHKPPLLVPTKQCCE